MDHVEARFPGSQLDDGLLALLLLRDLLGADLDASQLGELGDVLLHQIATRPFGENHLEIGPGEFLPLRLGARRKSCEAERASRGGAGQDGTARDLRILHYTFLPRDLL